MRKFCKKRSSKPKVIFLVGFVATVFLGAGFFGENNDKKDFSQTSKQVVVEDNGLFFEVLTKARTVEEFLAEKEIEVSQEDKIVPRKDVLIFSGSKIEIIRANPVEIKVDGKDIFGFSLGKTVEEALEENGVMLSHLDKVTPGKKVLLEKGTAIVVTRINVEEKKINEELDFETIIKKDSKMGWRDKKIKQKGEKGIEAVTYKITYKNGKELSRVVLKKERLKEPIDQIEVWGTYVKTGKAKKGQGTWYAYQGGMFAASTTIPKGEYAKVTNTANGKSVIVQINDYGPQGKDRIIDLDKVAFAKIASLGAGVIEVKVERILN